MLPLVFRLVQCLGRELGQAHVGVHLAMDQILIDGGQFAGQQVVEHRDGFLVAFHGHPREC